MSDVVSLKKSIPFRRFNNGVGHKKDQKGPARYPVNAAKQIVKLLESAESNAQFKGLNSTNLVITYIKADFASRPMKFGRQRRRKMKRTNIDIIVEEKQEVKKESKPKQVEKKNKTKTVEKKENKEVNKEEK